MKRIYLLLGITLAVGAVLGLLGSRMLSAQEPLRSGTVLQRTELKSTKGTEAILVLRDLPPGRPGRSGGFLPKIRLKKPEPPEYRPSKKRLRLGREAVYAPRARSTDSIRPGKRTSRTMPSLSNASE